MSFQVRYFPKKIDHSIRLPASKSESNRLLVLDFLSGCKTNLINISQARDTVLMQKNLRLIRNGREPVHIDCQDAGTVFRFLLALCAAVPGEYIIDGTPRLRERPVAPLVDALRELGADICYLGQEGCAPLKIKGKALKGGNVSLDAGLSSQFVSALLLIAPFTGSGLEINLSGLSGSVPYVRMTLSALSAYGAYWTWEKETIAVSSGIAPPGSLHIENDWSALAFFLPVLARQGGKMSFPGLYPDSCQGDKAMLQMMGYFGLYGEWTEEGLVVVKKEISWNIRSFSACFRNYPDLVPAFLVHLILDGRAAGTLMTGLESLRYKESDRIAALSQMAASCGHSFRGQGDKWQLEKREPVRRLPPLEVFQDHRLAMSFTLLSMNFASVELDDISCVEKSFPSFWRELAPLGFQIDS
jgi:3-phosphoshikimate 1-carboxyvinyltransferase